MYAETYSRIAAPSGAGRLDAPPASATLSFPLPPDAGIIHAAFWADTPDVSFKLAIIATNPQGGEIGDSEYTPGGAFFAPSGSRAEGGRDQTTRVALVGYLGSGQYPPYPEGYDSFHIILVGTQSGVIDAWQGEVFQQVGFTGGGGGGFVLQDGPCPPRPPWPYESPALSATPRAGGAVRNRRR